MTAEEIRDALKRQPYEPFDVRLADGRTFTIPHPDYIAISPSPRPRHIVVYTPRPESPDAEYRAHWIDLNLIAELTIPSEAPAQARESNGA